MTQCTSLLSQREGKKKGKNGKGREGKGKKGKKRKEKGREKKGREGKGRGGKGRMGRERKGKEGKAHYLSVYLIEHHKGPGQTLQFSAISAKMISRGTQKKERKKERRKRKERRKKNFVSETDPQHTRAKINNPFRGPKPSL